MSARDSTSRLAQRVAELESRLEEAQRTLDATLAGEVDSVHDGAEPLLLRAAQRALQESEERFRALVEHSHEAVLMLDGDGRVGYISPSSHRVLGRDVAGAAGLPVRELVARYVHDADQVAALVGFRRMQDDPGERVELLFRLRRRDGSYRIVEAVGVNRLSDAAVGAIVVNCRDATQRADAERRERQAAGELRLREQAIDAMEQGLLIVDAAAAGQPVIYANRGYERVTGYEIGAVVGRDWRFLRGADTDPAAIAEIERALRDGVAASVEILNYRADGTPFWNQVSITPIREEGGRLSQFVAVMVDVSSRKRAELELAEREALLSQVLDLLPVGVWIADRDGNLIRCNREAERIWGGRHFVGRDRYAEFKGWWLDSRERIAAEEWALARAIAHGETSIEERIEIEGFDGERRVILNSAVPIRDADGEIAGAIIVNGDITDKVALERQLLESQKLEAVGRLAGGIAHDFNNLLGVVSGYGELLLDSTPPESAAREPVEEILRASERAAALTRQLLAFGRRQVVEPRLLDLNAVVSDLERLLRRVIGEDIEMTIAFDSEIGAVRADPNQIQQVLMNLVVNARDAMPQGGHLELRTARAATGDLPPALADELSGERWVELRVSDTGHGMDEATRARAFEPFFTTKESGKGTGLGLATAYGIVRLARGSIWIDSSPGRGSTFRIFLPVADGVAPHHEPATPPRPPEPRRRVHILLVEDEPALRDLMRRALASAGHEVEVAGTVDEAKAAIDGRLTPFDLVVSDVMLPGGRGWEVADHLRQVRPGAPVLFMSGYSSDLLERRDRSGHAERILEKPFSMAQLLAAVDETLQAASVERRPPDEPTD